MSFLVFPVCCPAQDGPIASIKQSTDILWLEKLAGAFTYDSPGFNPETAGKLKRPLAYTRLGEIGTAESLAAVRRIEAKGRMLNPVSEPSPLGFMPHPAGHFSNSTEEPLAQVEVPGGVSYALVYSSMMGGTDLFLVSSKTPKDKNSWTRPRLIPNRIYRGVREPALTYLEDGTLLFTFIQNAPGGRGIMEGQISPVPTAPVLGKQEWRLSVKEIFKDTDGDGWTDIEEARIGLDPNKPDTDGDGIPDGKDICPDRAPVQNSSADEDSQILQKVFFSTFGLSGSRHALFIDPKSAKVDVWGYAGPVLYNIDRLKWRKEHPEGAVYLSWRIESKTGTEAYVNIHDWEGPLASSSQKIKLRKTGGEWYVVANLGGVMS